MIVQTRGGRTSLRNWGRGRLSKKSFVGFHMSFCFFPAPEVVNFLLKSLLETTFAQSKQIWSFDDGDKYTRSIDLVGVESAHSAIEVKDSQMKPETPNASHATPHFWREKQMKTHQARQVDLSRLRRSRSALLAKRSTCSKSRNGDARCTVKGCN